jgi:hypothetical protein
MVAYRRAGLGGSSCSLLARCFVSECHARAKAGAGLDGRSKLDHREISWRVVSLRRESRRLKMALFEPHAMFRLESGMRTKADVGRLL